MNSFQLLVGEYNEFSSKDLERFELIFFSKDFILDITNDRYANGPVIDLPGGQYGTVKIGTKYVILLSDAYLKNQPRLKEEVLKVILR